MSGIAQDSGATVYQKRNLTSTISASSPASAPLPANDGAASSLLKSLSDDERGDPVKWQNLLEGGLPIGLRSSLLDANSTRYDISVTAEVLLAAQETRRYTGGFDLLYRLAAEQGRWPAALWIIKHLIDAYGSQALKSNPVLQVTDLWNVGESLDQATRRSFRDVLNSGDFIRSSPGEATLGKLTDDEPDNMARDEVFAHRVLGQIWHSLGLMTAACAGREMQPEILEMIAYLHHMGIMPVSIYNQKPSKDSTSLQQPPSMNLLSSRMLVSLSDAAWRARERSLAEEAMVRDGKDSNMPRSRYKINVGGLRPEAWLELLLWSSLHGGWIKQGADIFHHISKSGSDWKPFAWRSVVPTVDSEDPDWEKLGHIFNTRLPSSMDDAELTGDISIEKTVSTEVVNAYVDALISSTRVGVGERGISPVTVLERLVMLKRFLERSNLSLVAGSWDTVVSRLADIHEHFLDQPYHFRMLVELSPVMGAELGSTTRGDTPEYVFDGSAAVIGLFHRAIRSRIADGDVQQALQLFKLLLDRADANKEQSMIDLIKKFKSAKDAHRVPGLFNSNFAGITYPGFEMQIPATLSGPLLDLAMDAGALQFASWLIYSNEVDGPVIPVSLYLEPAIVPALLRFAADTDDKPLLSKIIDSYRALRRPGASALPHYHLRSFFTSQVMRKSWKGADAILQRMTDEKNARFKPSDLAHLACAVLIEHSAAQTVGQEVQRSLDQVRALFDRVMHLCHDLPRNWVTVSKSQIGVLLLVMARADPYWTTYWSKYHSSESYYTFKLPTEVFNTLLQGIIKAYDLSVGRKVLGVFWPHELREKQSIGRRKSAIDAGEPIMSRSEPSALDNERRIRRSVTIGPDRKQHVVLYGGLLPDAATMRILFNAALQEFNSAGQSLQPEELIVTREGGKRRYDRSPSGMLLWAIRRLQEIGVRNEDILDELRGDLSEDDIADIGARLTRSEESTGNSNDADNFEASQEAEEVPFEYQSTLRS